MDIKLRARLSAYSKLHGVIPEECDHESVTNEEIDSLFDGSVIPPMEENSCAVSYTEIDSLFK